MSCLLIESRTVSYTFGQNRRYAITVANTRRSREEAWRLVYQAYLDMGYIEPNLAEMRLLPQDASPSTTVLLIRCTRTDRVLAALTFTPDGPCGVPMEKHHPEAIARLRERGAKICEIGKLVCFTRETERASPELLMHAFKIAYLAARRLDGCTDLVIEVRPHHVGYYRRILLFATSGPEQTYDTVNGKVIVTSPLELDLSTVEERYRAQFDRLEGTKNLFRFFINDDEPHVVDWLRRERRAMSTSDFRHFFMKLTRIYQEATPDEQFFLRSCYRAVG